MFLTVISTISESSDHYLYYLKSKKEPSYEQLIWWLKENSCDKNDDRCFESINQYETVKLSDIEDEKLKEKDPFPNMEFL